MGCNISICTESLVKNTHAKKNYQFVILALHNTRSNFFHTILSLLGIVIGVASLVSILSLIDGMEQYAKDELSNTTSLKAIRINSEVYKHVDGVRIRKDSVSILSYDDFLKLQSDLKLPAMVYFWQSMPREIMLLTDTTKNISNDHF